MNLHGWLVVNHFMEKQQKFSQITSQFKLAADQRHVYLDIVTNVNAMLRLTCDPDLKKPDFVLFWDKDVRLALLMEQMGLRLFNCASAIAACDDKIQTWLQLKEHGIRMPKTIPAPMIYEPVFWEQTRFVNNAIEELGFPMIVKEAYGSFGEQVYLVNSMQELLAKMNSFETKPFLLQEFIDTSKGRDIRIQIVGDEAVCSMYRHSITSDFRANVTRGGQMESYTPNLAQISLATRACEILHLDFAGVDLLFGPEEEPILCEINSNAHFINLFKATGVNVSNHIMDYIIHCFKEKN